MDYALKLFDVKNAKTKWNLASDEFTTVLQSEDFPNKITWELQNLPTNNITNQSYQMYTYMKISNFNDEQDFLLKFVETKENEVEAEAEAEEKKKKTGLRKSKAKTKTRTNSKVKQVPQTPYFNLPSNNTVFNVKLISQRLFNLIDVNSDGLLEWYDFGHFFQTFYLFSKFDPEKKGRLTAGDAFEKYSEYSDFPKISYLMKKRAKRLTQFNQDIYIDAFTVLVILRIEDIISLYTRRTDTTTLYEVELKRVFLKANLQNINDGILNNCLRGVDSSNVPKYDWECAFNAGLTENIKYYDSAASYNTAKANNITLTNTVFYNVDPGLAPPAAAPKRFF